MKTPQLLFIIIFFLTVLSSGCAKVAHLQELLRIKGYADEKDAQAVVVQRQDERFAKFLQVVKRGETASFADQKSVWLNFGPPIYETQTSVEAVAYQVWMYRYSTQRTGSDKVYLYFDQQGYLKIYDYSPGGTMTTVTEVTYDKK